MLLYVSGSTAQVLTNSERIEAMSDKILDLGKSVYELCSTAPETAEILADLGFTDITKPGMLQTAGRFMTIPKGAAMKKINLDTIKKVFEDKGFTIKE
jgi:hypothetical protein